MLFHFEGLRLVTPPMREGTHCAGSMRLAYNDPPAPRQDFLLEVRYCIDLPNISPVFNARIFFRNFAEKGASSVANAHFPPSLGGKCAFSTYFLSRRGRGNSFFLVSSLSWVGGFRFHAFFLGLPAGLSVE